jgi:hypothetical protein
MSPMVCLLPNEWRISCLLAYNVVEPPLWGIVDSDAPAVCPLCPVGGWPGKQDPQLPAL